MPSEANTLTLGSPEMIWPDLLAGPGLGRLQELLPAYLLRQRWFGAKSRAIAGVRVLDWVELPTTPAALVFLEVTYADASAESKPDIYQLPLALTTGVAAEAIRAAVPASILASITTSSGPAILHDATAREDVRQSLLSLIETETQLTASIPPSQDDPVILSEGGAAAEVEAPAVTSGHTPSAKNISTTKRTGPTLTGRPSTAFTTVRGTGELPARSGSAEQSNTSILYGNKLILKLFRRLQPGENPDAEIGRFLTEVAHYPRIPTFLGQIVGQPRGSRTPNPPSSEQTTLAMLQGLVENEGDGWQHTLDQLARYYQTVAPIPPPADTGSPPSFLDDETSATIPAAAREYASASLEAAALLGRRTAELHLALATPTGALSEDVAAAFQPEPFTAATLAESAARVRVQIALALEALQRALPSLGAESTADAASLVLARRAALLAQADAVAEIPPQQAGLRIRIHGDYHLGQVLRAHGDYVLLDFEGEPARTLAERRAKQSPLRDVAGMVRSFSYAAYSALDHFAHQHPAAARTLEPWAQLWQNAVSTQFVAAWRTTIAVNPPLTPAPIHADRLFKACLLEKALYELLYELNNRPTWLRIPLAGILALS